MEHVGNSSESSGPTFARAQRTAAPPAESGDAYLYILIVMSFYGVFLCGIMVGYFHSKRKEKRRTNVFTRLVHEEEEREWGAFPRKHSFPSASACAAPPSPSPPAGPRCVQAPLPFYGNHGNHLGHLRHEGTALPSPLACALCAEQSSVSSLCSSADTRFAIEEESDSGTAEGPDETLKGGSGNSSDDSG